MIGIVSTLAGNGSVGYMDGNSNLAQFNLPSGITLDKEENIIICDCGNDKIRKISTTGE